MSTWVWIVIAAVVVVVLVAIVWSALRAKRRRQLQDTFGREYDRTVEQAGGRRAAEQELLDRKKQHEQLDIRPLSAGLLETDDDVENVDDVSSRDDGRVEAENVERLR